MKAIITRKIQLLEDRLPQLKFNQKLTGISVNKIYSTSQDIRKVISFIIENYELLLTNSKEDEQQ